MSSSVKHGIELQKIVLEVNEIPFNVVFTRKVHSNNSLMLGSVKLLSFDYQDHRGVWLDTGLRYTDTLKDSFKVALKAALLRRLDNSESDYDPDDYSASSFSDHLYGWGYSERDQLEYNPVSR